jgi:hypothetical protein
MNISEPGKLSRWWLGAILAPLLMTAIGITVGLASPQRDSDWIGVAFIIPFVVGLTSGCLVSVVCSVFSLLKKESRAGLAMLFGLTSLGVLVFAAVKILSAKH